MSGIALQASTGGSAAVTIAAPEVNSPITYLLPKQGGKVAAFGAPAAKTLTGTSVDFTNGVGDVVIPDEARRITILLDGVSTSGTSNLQVQIGTGSFDVTGYTSSAMSATNAASTSTTLATTGFIVTDNLAATEVLSGVVTLHRIAGSVWITSGNLATSAPAAELKLFAGRKTLSGALDRISLTTVNGTDTFDAGTISILVE